MSIVRQLICGFRSVRSLVFYVVFCRSLFVLLSFFLWLLCCLSFFDLRLLITSLSSSNFSYKNNQDLRCASIKIFFFKSRELLHKKYQFNLANFVKKDIPRLRNDIFCSTTPFIQQVPIDRRCGFMFSGYKKWLLTFYLLCFGELSTFFSHTRVYCNIYIHVYMLPVTMLLVYSLKVNLP